MFGKNQIIQNLVAYLRYQNLYAIKEKCQHGSIQVPYSYYDCGIPDYFTSVPLHWHSEMELNYIKSGRRRVLVPVSQEPPGYHELHDSVRTIMQCAHKNLATSDLLLKGELLRLFYLLASTPGLCTEHTVSTESRMTETLRPVLTYIQKHHSESVTIEQLAKIAHMSSSYFMSCFKQNFGLGAIEYLNQVRIRSACDLLRNTDRSISDIAFDTGFHNLSNFNRQFRTKVGCSPQTYRKESVLS